MASLRELSKRLKSTGTVLELSGAMRSVAAAKLARVGKAREACEPYAKGLSEAAALVGSPTNENGPRDKEIFVLLSGNRGLCGGFNRELFDFFETEVMGKSSSCLVVTCGEKAKEYCERKGIKTLFHAAVSDVPAFPEAKALSEALSKAFSDEHAVGVSIVYRRFENMLRQPFEIRRFLPAQSSDAEETEVLFIPDRETLADRVLKLALAADAYDALLSCASGAQAASVMAMRSSYDNAVRSRDSLELSINRLRQAGVTASVIETSSGNKE